GADAHHHGRQRPEARRRHRHMRERRPVRAGGGRLADCAHRRPHRRRDPGVGGAMQLEDLATTVLQQARQLGATAGDVLIASGESFSAGVRFGEVEKVHNAREKRMGLRLFVGHSSAVTSTANSTREAVQDFVAETVALAKATAADEFSGLPAAEDLARDFPDLDLADSPADLTAEKQIALAREAEAAAL